MDFSLLVQEKLDEQDNIKGINFRDFANFGQLYRPKTKNYTRR